MKDLAIYLKDTWSFFRRHVKKLLLVIMPIALPLSILEGYIEINPLSSTGYLFFVFFIQIVAYSYLQILVIAYVTNSVSDIPKESINLHELAMKRWLSFGIYYVMAGIVIIAGTLLFIVPGLIAFVRLLFGEILSVNYNKNPIQAFGESWSLTKPYQKDILFGLLILAVLVITPLVLIDIAISMIGVTSILTSTFLVALGYVSYLPFTIFALRVFADAEKSLSDKLLEVP